MIKKFNATVQEKILTSNKKIGLSRILDHDSKKCRSKISVSRYIILEILTVHLIKNYITNLLVSKKNFN